MPAIDFGTIIIVIIMFCEWMWHYIVSPRIVKKVNNDIDEKIEKERKTDFLFDIVRDLMHDLIREKIMSCVKKKYKTKYDERDIGNLVYKYTKIGGNHDVELLLKDLEMIPLKDTKEILEG